MGKEKKSTRKFLKSKQHIKQKASKKDKAQRLAARIKALERPDRPTEDELLAVEPVEPSTLEERKELKPLKEQSAMEFMSSGFSRFLSADPVPELSEDELSGEIVGGEEEESEECQDADVADPALVKSVKEHQAELERLKLQDPKFYQFLQEQDAGLLDFGGDDEESDDDDDARSSSRKVDSSASPVLTLAMIDRWTDQVLSKSPQDALRKLLLAFKTATLLDRVEDIQTDENDKVSFRIESSKVYDAIMSFCLQNMDGVFLHLLNLRNPALRKHGETDEDLEAVPVHDRPGWESLKKHVKSYFGLLIGFAKSVQEDAVAAGVAEHLESMVPFMATFPRLAKVILRVLLDIWATRSPAARTRAFLCVHRMASELPYPFVELALKGAYLAFVRSSKFVRPQELGNLRFMRNCVVELCGIDADSTYQMAFVYVRQLAIHLRAAIVKRSSDAVSNVTNWQFFMSLSVWAHMLAAQARNADLRQLIYPVVQVIGGIISVAHSTRYFPLRFRLCGLLNLMSAAAAPDIFINAAPYALEALQAVELHEESRRLPPSYGNNMNLYGVGPKLMLNKKAIHTRAFQTAVMQQIEEIVIASLHANGLSLALPDLCVPILSQLRRFRKETPNTPHRQQIVALMKHIDAACQVIHKFRATAPIDFAPKNVLKAQMFLKTQGVANPLEHHAAMLRKRVGVREKTLVQGRQDDGVQDTDLAVDDIGNGEEDEDDGSDDLSRSDGDESDDSMSDEPVPSKRGAKKSEGARKKQKIDPLAANDDVLKEFSLGDFGIEDSE